MKLLVSCDQVFDCLTRGPFPSGSRDDDAVQRHLESCHECRQLAEALRPAVALLHEALPESEAADLPSYGAAEADDGLCERADGALAARIRQIMDRQEVRPRRINSEEKWLSALRFTAAAMLLAALATLLTGVFWPQHGERRMVIRPSFSGKHQPNAEGLLHLASLKLPEGCLPGMQTAMSEGGANPLRSAIGAAHVCCTRCHAAGKEGVLTQRTVVALQQSCVACHEARS
ncbi:MAG TPA: hypothetical protein VMP01_06545 [Pirellulaceae bacterium]|nr:hypothetical protein [Pirellulaceae bacterium]